MIPIPLWSHLRGSLPQIEAAGASLPTLAKATDRPPAPLCGQTTLQHVASLASAPRASLLASSHPCARRLLSGVRGGRQGTGMA